MEQKLEQIYKVNRYQTPLTEELKDSLHKEIWSELTEYISSIEFIKRLIAPEEVRGFAKDRRKDEEYNDGRIAVDITRPHILEDMDFFREKALFYEKHGRYTLLTPNPNPKSDYALFWKEELRRWKYGLVRESDGEWIPGQLYFYWNYSPIWLVETVSVTKEGKKKGERKRKFPKPWLGDYLFYHYMEQGRSRGQHGKLLKTRGVGFDQPNDTIVQKLTGPCRMDEVKINDYLVDRFGKKTKVLDIYPQGLNDIYEITLLDGRKTQCGLNHLWSVYDKNKGTKNKNKLYTYTTKYLIENGLFWKNKNNNNLYKYYIPDLIEPVNYDEKELIIDPYILGCLLGDGSLTGSTIRIATDDYEIVNEFEKRLTGFKLNKDKTNNNYICKDLNRYSDNYGFKNKLKENIEILNLNVTTSYKFIPEIYKRSSVEQRFELIKGLMDTDGSISKNGNLEFSNSNEKLLDDVAEILRSLGIKCTKGLGRLPHIKNIKGIDCNIKQEYRLYINTNLNLFNLTRKKNRIKNKKIFKNNPIINIVKLNEKKETRCFVVDNDEHLYLTTDFIPTHNSFKMGSISPCNMYTLPGSGNPNFHLASEKTFLSGDKGIWGKVLDTLDWIAETTPLPKMRLVDDTRNMNVQLGFKDEYGTRKGIMSSVYGISLKDAPEKARGIRGPLIHYEEDGLFPNLEKAWNVNLKAVEDGDVGFGYMLAGGTGGTEGASFEGSEKLFYSPGGYNIYGIPNVFDKNTNGDTLCGFFWGGYLNRNGCYDEENGEPDVIKSLIEILKSRFKIKYNSTDPNAITQKKAEEPITPQEAIMRTEGTVFPVADLKDYLESVMIQRDTFLAQHYVGELVRGQDGKLKWRPNADKYPIRSYDKDTANREGCLEIFEMPKENANGEIVSGRYIAGIDPIDADAGTSLFSILVMDTFTDRIVAEYTGRPKLAEEAYELALRILEFYNAQANYESNLKGLFSYFDKKNALHRLCDVPQILKDMEFVKGTNLYGNKAKGTLANQRVNKWGRVLQADWMLTKAYSEDENEKLNLHTIRSIPYIEECIKWNADGNFDRVSAGIMLMILREDRYKRTQSAIENQHKKIDSLSNDNFFKKNYLKSKAIDNLKIHY